jgi:hypothetical protein
MDWRAPSECPGHSQVEGDVYRLLGSAKHSPRAPVVARADVVEQPDGRWHVVLSTLKEGRSGRRELEAESCAALASATALILAMMIDPEAMRRADADTVVGGSRPVPAAAGPRRTPGRAPVPSSPWRGFAGPVAAVHAGLAPRWPAAAGARLGVGSGRSRVDLQGLYSTETLGQSDEDPALRGRFALWSAGLRLCRTNGAQAVALGGCVGADYNQLQALGDAAAPLHNGSATARFWTVAMAGLLAIRAGEHVTLPVALEVLAPTRRPEFVFRGRGTVYRPAQVAGRASLAVELSFP